MGEGTHLYTVVLGRRPNTARGRGGGGGGKGGGGTPVHRGARQASQNSKGGEACLVQHNQQGETNGDGETNFNTSKHDSQPSSVENQPVKLVDLHGT